MAAMYNWLYFVFCLQLILALLLNTVPLTHLLAHHFGELIVMNDIMYIHVHVHACIYKSPCLFIAGHTQTMID